jgi:hypothetical protein
METEQPELLDDLGIQQTDQDTWFLDNHLNNNASIGISLLPDNAKYLVKCTLKYNNFLNFLKVQIDSHFIYKGIFELYLSAT